MGGFGGWFWQVVLVSEWDFGERFVWVVLVGVSGGWVVVVVGNFGKWFDG